MSDEVYASLEWLDSETIFARALPILIERGGSDCRRSIVETDTPTATTSATSGRNNNASRMIRLGCIRLQNTTLPDGRRVFTVRELGNNTFFSHTHTYVLNLRNGAIVASLAPRISSVIAAFNHRRVSERPDKWLVVCSCILSKWIYPEAIFCRPFGHHPRS
jgi:hypothetical protein